MTRAAILTLALVAAFGTVQVRAQRRVPGGPPGFRAVAGQAVAAFQVPADVRLVAQERLGPGGSIGAERYKQFVGDAEVLGGQLTIYRDDAGVRDAVIGAHYADLAPVNTVRVSAARAQSIAAGRHAAQDAVWTVQLMLRPDTARYFYRVESRGFSARWFYWVDAETGAVVNEYNGLTTSSGVGVLGDTKLWPANTLTTKQKSSWRMVSSDNRLKTNDARNRSTLPGPIATDTNDVWDRAGRTSPGQHALVDAHFYADVTDDYYRFERGFDWKSHYSQGIVSSAHVGSNYGNAYWNGTQMAYGDGDGITYGEFSGDLDVVAHELTHGVTEATSNLLYQDEPGALNESFSDIMATAIEWHHGSGNWTIGEDITMGGNGLRNMANPAEDGQPSHYQDLLVGSYDNGYVHFNSGIPNHWFYLLVNGGQNATATRASGANVAGIGLAAAVDVAFAGFTALTPTADFCAARASTIAVAGQYAANVAGAWDEVGVDEPLCKGNGGSGPDTTPPVILDVQALTVFGNIFQIAWFTEELSDSEVEFCTGKHFRDPALVNFHGMLFQGPLGTTYQYRVHSTDASGNKATSAWYFFTVGS